MTVHELATNAAKYGALKAEKGRIEIQWRVIHPVDGADHLTFAWQERGVQIQDLSPPRGFGSEVIERSLAYMLGGTAELRLRPDGVSYQLEFPLRAVREGT
jgi:two-component system CheB/CheR fusion protein